MKCGNRSRAVSRNPTDRLVDIAVACERIAEYAERSEASDDLVFDAIRMRLLEIGEAVKELDDEARRLAPEVPWAEIARMRDMLAEPETSVSASSPSRWPARRRRSARPPQPLPRTTTPTANPSPGG